MASLVESNGTVGLNPLTLAAFVSRVQHVPSSAISMDVRPLRGGLEAAAVARVGARWRQASGRSGSMTFVAKRLEGSARREAELYRLFLQSETNLAPRLLGVEQVGPATSYLYLEYVRQTRSWPWRELVPTSVVLGRLAALHASSLDAAQALGTSWDYEAELSAQAAATLEFFERGVRTPGLAHLRKYGPALRRLIATLPRLRSELLNVQPFGKAVLHGDVHSRNVVMRFRSGTEQPVFIDWARSRVGSPLEDVSSWLESLGCWEHECVAATTRSCGAIWWRAAYRAHWNARCEMHTGLPVPATRSRERSGTTCKWRWTLLARSESGRHPPRPRVSTCGSSGARMRCGGRRPHLVWAARAPSTWLITPAWVTISTRPPACVWAIR